MITGTDRRNRVRTERKIENNANGRIEGEKMKKLWTVMLIIVLALVMTACGGDDDDSGKSGKKKADSGTGKKEPTEAASDEKNPFAIGEDKKGEEESEEKLIGLDEEIAEELRHACEISAAEIDVYDEILLYATKVTGPADILKLKDGKVTFLCEVPYLKDCLEDFYGEKLEDGTLGFRSVKYKKASFYVSFEVTAGSQAMFVKGRFE